MNSSKPEYYRHHKASPKNHQTTIEYNFEISKPSCEVILLKKRSKSVKNRT